MLPVFGAKVHPTPAIRAEVGSEWGRGRERRTRGGREGGGVPEGGEVGEGGGSDGGRREGGVEGGREG